MPRSEALNKLIAAVEMRSNVVSGDGRVNLPRRRAVGDQSESRHL